MTPLRKALEVQERLAPWIGFGDKVPDSSVLADLAWAIAQDPDLAREWQELVNLHKQDSERCPGCGCPPGNGLTDGCEHPEGCGYFRNLEKEMRW